jgi:anti-sigma B factor antagonist
VILFLGENKVFQQHNNNLIIHAEDPLNGHDTMRLRLSGELTGEGAYILKQAIEPLFVSPVAPRLELKMDDVSYMDSSGVGIIIAIIQRMRDAGGKLEIHGLSEVGRDLFKILKLASLKEVVTVNDGAISSDGHL